MRRPQFSLRQWMIATAVLSVILALAVQAKSGSIPYAMRDTWEFWELFILI
jgi:hypothetical protein